MSNTFSTQPQWHPIINRFGEVDEVFGTWEYAQALKHHREDRSKKYDIAHQLDLLYQDIQDGVFGDAAKQGKFSQYVQSVKSAIPKPTPEAGS
jgi:hypothetical protein